MAKGTGIDVNVSWIREHNYCSDEVPLQLTCPLTVQITVGPQHGPSGQWASMSHNTKR